MSSEILSKVKDYAERTFREKGSTDAYYHNFNHAADVAKVAEEIADASGINENDKEVLLIAAWLHDIGHIEKCEGH